MQKQEVMRATLERLERDLATLRTAADETRKGATHEESRAENDKDTRGLEASYLARGQAMRVEETAESIQRLRFLALREFGEDDPVDLGALVSVEVDGEPRRYFLVPAGGGMKIGDDPETILVTPKAPVGRALLGKRAGDEFELRLGGRLRFHEILSVA